MDWRWKFIKRPLKKIGQTKAAMYIVSGIVYLYAKLVGLTTSWQTKGVDKFYHLIKENNGVILVIWHGRALMLPYFYDRSSELQALVSPHRDGRIIAGLLQRFGIGTIGGSSNENASGGALGLMHTIKREASIAIIPDGPRGPRMHMNKSPIYFAQKTGKPIVCGAYSIKNSKIIEKSWDKMMIPFPFSEGVCLISDPLFIPADASEEELEKYRIQLEDILNQTTFECDNLTGRRPILPDDGSEPHKIKRKKCS